MVAKASPSVREASSTLPNDAGVARLVLGAELQAELPILEHVGADLQELEIADERHAPVGIAEVRGLEPGPAHGVVNGAYCDDRRGRDRNRLSSITV